MCAAGDVVPAEPGSPRCSFRKNPYVVRDAAAERVEDQVRLPDSDSGSHLELTPAMCNTNRTKIANRHAASRLTIVLFFGYRRRQALGPNRRRKMFWSGADVQADPQLCSSFQHGHTIAFDMPQQRVNVHMDLLKPLADLPAETRSSFCFPYVSKYGSLQHMLLDKQAGASYCVDLDESVLGHGRVQM